jgi:hypothetical protein
LGRYWGVGSELAGILRAKGLLADGKIVIKPAASDSASPLGTDAGRARGIEYYLNTRHALEQLAPWFEGVEPNPFAEGKTPAQMSREILARFRCGLTFRNRRIPSISRITQMSRKSYRSAAAR